MSIETWKKEFYSVEAGILNSAADVVLLEHSIKKWEGLQTENLERHELRATPRRYDRIEDVEGAGFYINSASCSLCVRYLFPKGANDRRCGNCPLSKVRGDAACDEDADVDGDDPAPFNVWGLAANPEPMLHWLRKALKVAMLKEGK
mgnify:CR=1 FL=1